MDLIFLPAWLLATVFGTFALLADVVGLVYLGFNGIFVRGLYWTTFGIVVAATYFVFAAGSSAEHSVNNALFRLAMLGPEPGPITQDDIGKVNAVSLWTLAFFFLAPLLRRVIHHSRGPEPPRRPVPRPPVART